MLYPKPLEKLIWGDIEIFCQQGIPEDTYRDYKEDFPTNLEKTVAAMANALGGIILKRYLLGDGYEKTFYDMHRKSRI